MRANAWAGLVGVVAAGVELAAAELVAMFAGPESSPLFAVGSLVIDLAPPGAKDLMISLFGTGDKVALLVLLGIVVAALAVAAGILELRRPPGGVVVLVAVTALAILAVTTRAGASGLWAIPTVLGMLAGVVALRMLTARLRATLAASAAEHSAAEQGSAPPADGMPRRRFLLATLLAGAGALVVGVASRAMNAAATAVSSARAAITLPAAATPAPPSPAGTDLGLDGLTPYVTPNGSFYRIDTALQVPQVDVSSWSVTIAGMVENEITLTFDDLLALPLEEHAVTLACVSNEVGGDLIGNAVWLGYPIRELLRRAVPRAGADMVLSTSVDGFTAGSPIEALTDPDRVALLAVGMNGEPLPVEHGFPVRMVVAGLYGYVSATKWVSRLEVTRFADAEGYWTPRGWSALGPIKTESRIDTPRRGASVSAGSVAVAGVAWAQHTGVAGVEVQVDGGAWAPARLAAVDSIDTWCQWVYEWDATPGSHTLAVRATDESGYTQTPDKAPPAPDGATGWHTVSVTVS
ncbi:molybdopterin-dependent oxidoreductase [Cnuibacter sp. UC19_7]|uniref:molybdopterin-dependent oxidoreductase n=1 Tax=Cnuibacter sp. UC19_7 TaxID=3350166 RepID=UPI0036713C37